MRGPGVWGGNSRAGEAVLRFSAAPKGPKQESPGGGNPACGVGPGDPIRMRIRPALKGRNKILDHNSISQGGTLGWHVTAPSGRESREVLAWVGSFTGD